MSNTTTPTPGAIARDIADVLNEPTPVVMYQLVRTVREIGTDAVYDLAARALFIEATGGLPLGEPFNRKRTPGGVFFHLLTAELTNEQQMRVWGRIRLFKRTPKPVAEMPAQTPEPAPKATKPKRVIDGPPCAACEQPSAVVAKFHISRTGKKYLCVPCFNLGFAFTPSGDVDRLQERAA